MRKWILIGGGALLILIGALSLGLSRLTVNPAVSSFIGIAGLLVMSIALLAYYAQSQILAALIPGCLLSGLSLGLLASELVDHWGIAFALAGLGVGFFVITLVETAVADRRRYWALVAGAVLVGLAAITALAGRPQRDQSFEILLGAVLLALGIWMVWRQSHNAKRV